MARFGRTTGSFYTARESPWPDIEHDASTASSVFIEDPYQWSHTIGPGGDRLLLVGLVFLSTAGGADAEVFFNGVKMELIRFRETTGANSAQLWRMMNPPVGAGTVSFTHPNVGPNFIAGGSISFYNVNQTWSVEASADNASTGDPITISVTPAADRTYIVDAAGASLDNAISVGAGQVQRVNTTDGVWGSAVMSTEGIVTPAGATTMSWTGVGGGIVWVTVATAVRPVFASDASLITGTGTITFTPTGTTLGAGALAAVDTITFAQNVLLGGDGALLGVSAPAFSLSGAVLGDGALLGTGVLTFTTVGDLTAEASEALLGAIAMVFADAATMSGAGALLGVSAPVFAESVSLSGSGALLGTGTLTFAESVTLVGSGALAGTATNLFNHSAVLDGSGVLVGVAAETFAEVAALFGSGALLGTAAEVFGQAAALAGSGALAGTSSPVFVLSATPDLPEGFVSGTIGIVFSLSGSLSGSGALAGTSAPVFSLSGTAVGAGALLGSAANTFADAASLAGDGALLGAGLILFTPSGIMTAAGVVVILDPRARRRFVRTEELVAVSRSAADGIYIRRMP